MIRNQNIMPINRSKSRWRKRTGETKRDENRLEIWRRRKAAASTPSPSLDVDSSAAFSDIEIERSNQSPPWGADLPDDAVLLSPFTYDGDLGILYFTKNLER
ncbi:unnamed protein product [Eruca vesicaria subsp. sativa]|uniref:Uncharacterized protein n=1 Tax=Eruca vesicaria subsp. sativa TaxID=29727 RepID=A0ABC8LCG1_ERUVS|nr:unnamed protein product [Eruca vesicaria subsp. sativa]